MKRGLTQQEAMAYVGVRRRTWETQWAPRLTGIQQGVCLIYDRQDLDRLFDEIKAKAAGNTAQQQAQDAANDCAHNAPRNGRPETEKGRNTWAKNNLVSTKTKTAPGKLTSGGMVSDFASAVSLVLKKQNAG